LKKAKRNAIDTATAKELSDRLDELEADSDVWCSVLTGGPSVVSAGTDLTEPASPRTESGGEYGIIRRQRSKPILAAVEGFALGGGFEIVLACDLVVAAESSRFGLPEVAIGVIATCGGLFRGPRALPLNVAREMALCGAPLDAARLHQLGVVNRLVPDGAARDEAIALAEQICRNSPISIRESLTAINSYVAADDEAARRLTESAIAAIADSPDLGEGRTALFERRDPVWLGLA
jgi:enoyl-CoA hydratase/carnithine racemase